jgi:indole-3-glycerol phosphate synthase
MSAAVTGTYLDRIVADVRRRRGGASGASEARLGAAGRGGGRRSLVEHVAGARARGELAVIGEVKRRSPSVGVIDDAVDPASRALAYAQAGAAGISVLTEVDHFGGSLADLVAVAGSVQVPVLRKDFVVEAGQVDEAAAAGADAVLLIAALHARGSLDELVARAHELRLEVLLEVHDERELELALGTRADLVGINNRDLRTFRVDLATTERLAPIARDAGRVVVAESGVRDPADARRMHECGVDAVLVGEALMRAHDPAGALRALATASGRTHT